MTTPVQIERSYATLTLAFAGDPTVRWTYDHEPHRYLAQFPSVARVFGGQAFEAGTAYGFADGSGVALWLPPGVEVDGEAVVEVMTTVLSPEKLRKSGPVFEEVARYHPKEPHWYLGLIGIDPLHRNKGLGSLLMQHALERCDRERKVAYLEATNPHGIPFYERHGFEVVGAIALDATTTMFPMLRRAR